MIYLSLFLIGGVVGAAMCWLMHRLKLGTFQLIASEIVSRAECEAQKIAFEKQREIDALWQSERRKWEKEEERLKRREEKLEHRQQQVEKLKTEVEKNEKSLREKKCRLEEETSAHNELHQRLVNELEVVAEFTSKQAKQRLIEKIEAENRVELDALRRRALIEAEGNAEREASSIIATAINRLAVPCVSETTVNTVSLPHDEMKARIIGREGRNIRCLERVTGVNFLIDDTPGALVLSGFDPVRLHVAKVAVQELISDGRIHPTRIEEAVAKAISKTEKEMQMRAEEAALQAGAFNLHDEILCLLGKLAYRYSYGQNVLKHSLEVSTLMGIMAAELGLDQDLAKRIGLLHDMGKAVSHEMEGSHATIGYKLALKYGESEEVANGIGCHHYEMDAKTVEGSLCSAADALSASRPGARLEAVETYIKRLQALEKIAKEYSGVEKVYALQAGREVRVSVLPDVIDDLAAKQLATDLTRRIESELSYPGKIKVIVIRETRIVSYA